MTQMLKVDKILCVISFILKQINYKTQMLRIEMNDVSIKLILKQLKLLYYTKRLAKMRKIKQKYLFNNSWISFILKSEE